MVTLVDGRRLVGREDDRDPPLGESAQQVHDLRRGRWVKTRGGFIQEEGARLGEQLDRNAGPLTLTARQHPDRNVTPIGQVQVGYRFVDNSVGLVGRCARRQAESCRVLERAPQRHLDVDDVVLRDVADTGAGPGTGIDPNAVVHDLAGGRRPRPRKNLKQGGLSRSAAAHKSNQLTWLDGQGHIMEDFAPAGALADSDRVDAAPDGCPGLYQRKWAGRGRGVCWVERELCHGKSSVSSVGFTRLSRLSSGLLGYDSWSECGAIVETAGQPGRGSLTRMQLARRQRAACCSTRRAQASVRHAAQQRRYAIRRLMTPLGLMNRGSRPRLSAVKQLDGIRESVHRGRRALNCWAEPRARMTFEIRGRWPLIKRLAWRFSGGASGLGAGMRQASRR